MPLHPAERVIPSMWQAFGGLSRRLLISHMALASVPLLILSLIMLIQSRDALKQRSFDQLNSVAQLKEASVGRFVVQKRDALSLLSTDQSLISATTQLLADPDDSTLQNMVLDMLLAVQRTDDDYHELKLIDARDGHLLASTVLRERNRSYAQDAFFVQGRVNIYSSPISVDPLLNSPAIVVSAPVRNKQGETLAVLAARVGLIRIDQIMRERAGLGESGRTYLVDRSHMILFASDFSRTAGTSFAIEEALAQREGQSLYTNPANTPVIGVYRYLDSQDVALLSEQDQAEALAAIFRLQWFIAVTVALTVVAISITALLLARAIATPILAMARNASAVANGDLNVSIDTRAPDEVGVLANAFQRMTTLLREREAVLRQRQQELEQANAAIAARSDELASALLMQATLTETIQQLSTPVLPVLEGVLVLPLIGRIDSARAQQVQTTLLKAIEQRRAQAVLLDITGLYMVDQFVAEVLIKTFSAARLLGARVLLVGISPEVAQALISLGLDLNDIDTASDLRGGIAKLIRPGLTNGSRN